MGKPNGDTSEHPDAIEMAKDKAHREGKSPAAVCIADHSTIRGRRCGYCGTYFRGDDCG